MIIVYKQIYIEQEFKMTEDQCNVPKVLRDGTTRQDPFETQGGKYSPQKTGGWRPNEGDTHGDQVLEVPDCTDN